LSNATKEHYLITETHFSEAGRIAPAYFDLAVKKINEFDLNTMNPFEQFQTDIIRVISKETGNVSSDLKAHVTPGTINTYDLSAEIIEGDFIERDLPNNRKESYLVLEANYHDKFAVIPAHYVLKVRKTTAISLPTHSQTVYNLHGNNSRVYHNSQDQSNNVVNEANADVFKVLTELINDKVSDNTQLLSLLYEMEQAKGQSGYFAKYTAFIANAANHMTLIAPYIPALTAFLTSH
jgi:hypothetical protein